MMSPYFLTIIVIPWHHCNMIFCKEINLFFTLLLSNVQLFLSVFAEKINFRVNITDISTVNFYWNQVNSDNVSYRISCESHDMHYVFYSGSTVNISTVSLEPFVEHTCQLSLYENNKDSFIDVNGLDITFCNLAPGELG